MDACIDLSGMPPIGSHSDTVERLAEAVVVLAEFVVVLLWAAAYASRQNSAVKPNISPVAPGPRRQ